MKVLQLRPTLMPHQVEFVMDDKTPIQGFVGGYRSGKSVAGVWKSLRCAVELFPGEDGVIMSPISGMNQTNIVKILRDILPKTGLTYDHARLMSERCYRLDIEVGSKVSSIYLDVSAENASRMVGRSLAWGYFDEADVCRNADLAYDAFVQLKNRLSEAEHPLLFATSTPEGYGFMHRRFVEQADEDTRIWHVSMEDNFLLPKGYVAEQKKNIPASKQAAYVSGQFANIYSSTVYSDFDRVLNDSTMVLGDFSRYDPIHIGMDFNIDHMAAVVHMVDPHGNPHAVQEIVEVKDTTTMIAEIKRRFPGRQVWVYPDASGKNRNPAGVETSMQKLKDAGFKVVVDASNPPVGDRINCMNAMFLNGAGERRYRVNSRLCPTYVRGLERQAWVKVGGKDEPDKSNNIDHPLDAGGYFITKRYPIKGRPTARTMT